MNCQGAAEAADGTEVPYSGAPAVLEYGAVLPTNFWELQPEWKSKIIDGKACFLFIQNGCLHSKPEWWFMERRQMIAVLQNGFAVIRRAIQDGGAVGYSLAIAINRLFSFYLESSTHWNWRRTSKRPPPNNLKTSARPADF
jgi:hypothetical protein